MRKFYAFYFYIFFLQYLKRWFVVVKPERTLDRRFVVFVAFHVFGFVLQDHSGRQIGRVNVRKSCERYGNRTRRADVAGEPFRGRPDRAVQAFEDSVVID